MKELKFALTKVMPIMFSFLVLGMACGILYRENGFTFLEMFFSSAIIYSGSLQFVLAPLIISGASIIVIILLSFILSGRHLFYGVSLIEKIKINSLKGLYTASTITDETFSIITSIDGEIEDGMDVEKLYFFINIIAQLSWVVSTLIGYILGDIIPFDTDGIEFSSTALFIAIAISQTEKAKILLPQILAVISSFVAIIIVGAQNFILLAMVFTVVFLFVFRKQITQRLRER